MKVKTFLNKLMMNSSVDVVRIEKNGYTKAEFDMYALRDRDYGIYGNENVQTFCIHNKALIVNI